MSHQDLKPASPQVMLLPTTLPFIFSADLEVASTNDDEEISDDCKGEKDEILKFLLRRLRDRK